MTRCKQFNMFVEGAFFLGAFAAAWMAPALPFPPVLLPLFCMIAAAVIAGIVGYIPAKLKAGLGVNEFVSSLMLNFIVTADEGEIVLNDEIEEAKWFTPEEAKAAIRKNSTAEYFLLGALNELGRKK